MMDIGQHEKQRSATLAADPGHLHAPTATCTVNINVPIARTVRSVKERDAQPPAQDAQPPAQNDARELTFVHRMCKVAPTHQHLPADYENVSAHLPCALVQFCNLQ